MSIFNIFKGRGSGETAITNTETPEKTNKIHHQYEDISEVLQKESYGVLHNTKEVSQKTEEHKMIEEIIEEIKERQEKDGNGYVRFKKNQQNKKILDQAFSDLEGQFSETQKKIEHIGDILSEQREAINIAAQNLAVWDVLQSNFGNRPLKIGVSGDDTIRVGIKEGNIHYYNQSQEIALMNEIRKNGGISLIMDAQTYYYHGHRYTPKDSDRNEEFSKIAKKYNMTESDLESIRRRLFPIEGDHTQDTITKLEKATTMKEFVPLNGILGNPDVSKNFGYSTLHTPRIIKDADNKYRELHKTHRTTYNQQKYIKDLIQYIHHFASGSIQEEGNPQPSLEKKVNGINMMGNTFSLNQLIEKISNIVKIDQKMEYNTLKEYKENSNLLSRIKQEREKLNKQETSEDHWIEIHPDNEQQGKILIDQLTTYIE